MEEKMTQQITLHDGRVLGYAEFGDPAGTPVFYFHGFPSSRLDWRMVDDNKVLTELKVRIIAADRPGYGFSDFKRGRKMLDWAEDVKQLADNLNIGRFTVLGISGGGPYAASCAFRMKDRLTKVGIVSGMGPSNSPGMKDGVSWTLPKTPFIMRSFILRLTALGLERDPDQFLSRSKETFSGPDKQLLDRPELASMFVDGMQEAFRQGIKGANQEAGLYTQPWGFRLQDIATEVQLWHGEQDLNVPISAARNMADSIPNCISTFHKQEGHLTLPHNHIKEILNHLTT